MNHYKTVEYVINNKLGHKVVSRPAAVDLLNIAK